LIAVIATLRIKDGQAQEFERLFNMRAAQVS